MSENEKRLNGRIVNKHDIEANWLKATNFTPMLGELIVYDVDENHDHERIKIGDGVTNVNELPFYAGSWNDLDDRPVENEVIHTVTWDGNTEGLTSVHTGMGDVYKISDLTPSKELLIGQRFVITNSSTGSTVTGTISPDEVQETHGMTQLVVMRDEAVYQAMIIPEDGLEVSGSVFAEKGIYTFVTGLNTYVSELDIGKHVFEESYIPDTIARTADIITPVQSDWNTNDENSLSFVKNRTHWTERLENETIFDGTVTIPDSSVCCANRGLPIAFSVIAGETYYVTYDGITYEVVGQDDLYLGSQSLWTEGVAVDSEPPFAYGDGWFAASTSGDHTVKIVGSVDSFNKLDTEYLPYSANSWNGEVFNDYSLNVATGGYSHAEGIQTRAYGDVAHAEGYETLATGYASHAEGFKTQAANHSAHAEGWSTIAGGFYSHAEGMNSKAIGDMSHAEGNATTATGEKSHTEGYGTHAVGYCQHVQGKHNIEDAESVYAHIVGNGLGVNVRSNAHTIDWNGNAWFAGDVFVGSTSGTNKDDGSEKLATESWVDEKQRVVTSSTAPEDTNVVWIDPTDIGPELAQISIDTSLSQSGYAADAKATGEKIDSVVDNVDTLSNEVDTISGDLGALTAEVSSLYRVFIGKTIPVNPGNGAIWIDTTE